MSIYMTEEEQVQLLKSWWKRYSNIVLVILSIILLSISAMRYWNWRQDNILQQASVIYERMMLSFANKEYKSVRSHAQRLIDDYKKTIYADGARLTIAKIEVEQEKYDFAKKSLQGIIDTSHSTVMKNIAFIRLARIFVEENKYANALNLLSNVTDNAYLSVVDEIKGDILLAQGDRQKAVNFYKEAMFDAEKNGQVNLFLEMKLNALFNHSPYAA